MLNKKGLALVLGTFGTIIAIIVGLIAIYYLTEYKPEVVRVGGADCPTIDYYDYFSIRYKNSGNKNTIVNVTIYSDNLKLEKNSLSWFISKGGETIVPFTFNIDDDYLMENHNIENVTFYYTTEFKNKIMLTKYKSKNCIYQIERNGDVKLSLIK